MYLEVHLCSYRPYHTSNGTAKLTGLGTLFLTDISAGDVLTLNDASGNYKETRTVFTVDSNTTITCS